MLSHFNHIGLCVTLLMVAFQAPLSMGFSRQEYRSRLPSPSLGDLPDTGIKLRSPELQEDFLPSEPPYKTELLCYTLETNITFEINCALIKKKKDISKKSDEIRIKSIVYF